MPSQTDRFQRRLKAQIERVAQRVLRPDERETFRVALTDGFVEIVGSRHALRKLIAALETRNADARPPRTGASLPSIRCET